MPMQLVRGREPREMTHQPVGLFDGFADTEQDDMLYGYFSAASEVGGHLPPIRSFARIFVRRRKLQVFTSSTGTAETSVLQIDPALIPRRRRVRLAPSFCRRVRQGGR
jgi:hypothetical protein